MWTQRWYELGKVFIIKLIRTSLLLKTFSFCSENCKEDRERLMFDYYIMHQFQLLENSWEPTGKHSIATKWWSHHLWTFVFHENEVENEEISQVLITEGNSRTGKGRRGRNNTGVMDGIFGKSQGPLSYYSFVYRHIEKRKGMGERRRE